MKKENKFINFLEKIIIGILIFSFVILSYCLYVSFKVENEYKLEYTAEKTEKKEQLFENKDNKIINKNKLIENASKAVVGISRVKNTGSTIFLKNSVKELGIGSGFLVSDDGYIITNEHVSGEKLNNCYVTLEDGRNFIGNVVWSDNKLDLSIVKIKIKDIKYLELGNSNEIKIAQNVYAIGNPIGYEFQRTVTSGIVSGLNRIVKLEDDEKEYYMENLIQTDATINPGNSGGPLITENGKVIGVNSVKITSAEGIGCATPINIIKPILIKLKNTGKANVPILGIGGYDSNMLAYINKERFMSIEEKNGIYIEKIFKNSPAERDGLKEGDIITNIDKNEVDSMVKLKEYIFSKEIGDKIEIELIRNRRKLVKIITLDK